MSDLSKSLTVAHFKEPRERFAHGCSFIKSERAESDGSYLPLGIKKGKPVKNCIKNVKKIQFFSSESLNFWEWFVRITSKSLTSLLLKRNRERFADSRSFVKRSSNWSILSESERTNEPQSKFPTLGNWHTLWTINHPCDRQFWAGKWYGSLP